MPEPYQLYKKPGTVTASEIEIPVEIGMMGFSLEDITAGKQGYCVMPLGARDSTKWGGRKWARIKLTAMEEVRANRDIIVGNEQGDIKEHTPVELSYEKSTGGYQRVGDNFPLPVKSRTAITFTTVKATTSGDTQLVAPEAGMKIRVHWYAISNKGVAVSDVGMKFGAGDVKHRYALAADGGGVTVNLIDACWEGAINEILYGYLDGAVAQGIYFTVGYTTE